jgi:hypothetical protein
MVFYHLDIFSLQVGAEFGFLVLFLPIARLMTYGSVIPLKELKLNVPADDASAIQTLKNSSAAIFTEGKTDENGSTIILASCDSF